MRTLVSLCRNLYGVFRYVHAEIFVVRIDARTRERVQIIPRSHACVQKRYFFGETLVYLFCDFFCERKIKIFVQKIAASRHHFFVVTGVFRVLVLRIEKVEIAFFCTVENVTVLADG